MGGLDNLLETMLYYLTRISLWLAIYTFQRTCNFPRNLYFPKDRRPYIALYDKLQNLFPVNGNSFLKKPKLIATPYILK